jgi:nucleotide-binding universal stress UspA family protein
MTQSNSSTIVAVAGEDRRFDHVWRRGMEIARERNARLVLFDVDAKPSPLENPLPTEWSAHGEEEEYGEKEQFGQPLNLSDLEAVGRAPIADRVREARAAGVEAFGWLPEGSSADELRSYAKHEHAALVVVPAGTKFEESLKEQPDVPMEAVAGPRDKPEDRA